MPGAHPVLAATEFWYNFRHMNDQQRARYLRQVIFAPLGAEGQEKLLAARVLIVGCGATGSVIANTLARAGVGQLTIADRDFIELNNLQRQILFDEEDIAAGFPKAVAAANKLRKINSSIAVRPVVADINAENIEELVQAADLVLDGTDNFETRYLVNDACVKLRRPWIYGGAVGSYGATLTIIPHETACFRCVFMHAPAPGTLPTCDTAGVIAPIISVIGSIVSAEAIKLLSGMGPRNPDMLHIDLWENTFDSFHVPRRPDCPTCGQGEYEFLEEGGSGSMTAHLCGRNAVQVRAVRGHALDLPALTGRLSQVGKATLNEYLVQFVVDPYQMTIFADGRAIIKGTEDEAVAKSLYARYVGM
ncbi:MAG: ThiF family adenylyltransferase [Anaerolineae bacterium]